MKNIIIYLFVIVFATSCRKSEDVIVNETEDSIPDSFKNGVLVILNEKIYSSLFQDSILKEKGDRDSYNFLEFKNSRKKEIKDKFDALLKVKIPDDEIFVVLDSWFYLKTLNNSQLRILENEIGKSVDTLVANVEIQSRRPMMQGNFVAASRRPMMQDQWRYDTLNHRSRMIEFVGGGDPNSPVNDTCVWIMDTGIDGTHQDITISNFGRNNGISTVNSESDPYKDVNGHGTFIAGIIGGKSHNQGPIGDNQYDIGINGVHPGANLISVKALEDDGGGKLRDIKEGLEHVGERSRPGDILNLSFGLKSNNCKWGIIDSEILKLAGDQLKLFVVMSAGNEAESASDNFPGCLEGLPRLVTVGSMDNPYDEVYWFSFFSNYGTPPIDWLAPGEFIFTTAPGNQYVLVSGTSFSAAIVSGIIYSNGGNPREKGRITRGPSLPDYPIAEK